MTTRHRIVTLLDDYELRLLDELRGGITRSSYILSLIRAESERVRQKKQFEKMMSILSEKHPDLIASLVAKGIEDGNSVSDEELKQIKDEMYYDV